MKKLIFLAILIACPFLGQAQSNNDLEALFSEIEAITQSAEAVGSSLEAQRSKRLQAGVSRSRATNRTSFRSRWRQRQAAYNALKDTVGNKKSTTKKTVSANRNEAVSALRNRFKSRLSRTSQFPKRSKARSSRVKNRNEVGEKRSVSRSHSLAIGATSAKARLLQASRKTSTEAQSVVQTPKATFAPKSESSRPLVLSNRSRNAPSVQSFGPTGQSKEAIDNDVLTDILNLLQQDLHIHIDSGR